MDRHITIASVLNIANGLITFAVGLFLFIIITGSGLISREPVAIFVTSTVGSTLAIFFTVISIPSLLGGIGILKRKGWARIFMLIVSMLNILAFPIGTIIGIYTIWVLMQDEAIVLFD